MTLYRVETYETYRVGVVVEASGPAEAKRHALTGEGIVDQDEVTDVVRAWVARAPVTVVDGEAT